MRKDRKNQEIIDAYDYLSNAASSQDLTGLIPSAPSAEELESYEKLYHFLPPGGNTSAIHPESGVCKEGEKDDRG